MIHRVQRSSVLLGASALGVVWALAGTASAQDAGAAQLDEVVVTAQLRQQSAIEVPFALTAYNGQRLEDLGIQDFEELSAFTPGFLVQNQSPNNAGFVMRGITSDSGAATAEPRVSVFQDGVSISKSRGSYVELFDIERVEVAKGPQSTLYGRGALIGAVNVIQNKAEIGQWDGAGRFGIGDLDYRMGELMVNAPIGDTAAIRFATRLKTRDGYVDNLLGGPDYNGFNTQAFRLSGAFQPNDGFRFDLIANYQQDDSPGTAFKSQAYTPQDPTTGAVLGTREPWTGAALTPSALFDGGRALGLDREVWGLTGIARIDLSDSLTLTSTTAYREFNSYEAFDADGVSLPILTAAEDAHGEQTSQEFRINYDAGGRLTGFFGAGYFSEKGYQRTPVQFDERMTLAQLSGVLDGNPLAVGQNTLPASLYPTVAQGVITQLLTPLGAAALAPAIAANLKAAHIETPINSSELESFDLFADATYAFTDRFEMAAGIRYTRDEKTTGYASSVQTRSILGGLLAIQQGAVPPGQITALLNGLAIPGAANLPAGALPLFGLTAQPTANNGDFTYGDLEDEGVTWRLTARYALSDDASLYANYARGRRPEVLSPVGPSAPGGAVTFKQIDAETVDSFEIGAKAALMDHTLRLDGAVYLYNYENFQTTVQNGVQFIVTNAGKAEAYGFEGQAVWAVGDQLEVFGTYSYNHSRFKAGIYDGNHLRLSPDHRASVGVTWTLPVAGGAFQVQPTYSWQSEVFFDDDNDRTDLQARNLVPDLIVDEVQDSYGLLNLRLRYTPNGGHWSVEAFADNLLDEQFIKDAGNTGDGLGMPTFIAGEPRTVGVVFGIKY
jgi:outer membrane receptor protein involved in Fe transport